jgi:hypothetical protein
LNDDLCVPAISSASNSSVDKLQHNPRPELTCALHSPYPDREHPLVTLVYFGSKIEHHIENGNITNLFRSRDQLRWISAVSGADDGSNSYAHLYELVG